MWYANFHKPAWSLKTKYTLSFTASDPSGVKRVAVVKDGTARFEDYNSDYPDAASYGNVRFKTGAGETLLDGLLGATVQVEAADRHGNEGRITALERSNFYGHVASEYGSDSIYNEEIAIGAGLLSGFSVGAGESAAMIEAMANDPFGFIDSLTNILDLLDKLGMLDDLIRALPDSIDSQQEVANPYDKETQPTLHDEFRKGWYGGYAGYFLLSMVVGAEKVVKVAKKSSTLTDLVEKLDSNGKLRKAAKLLKRSQRVTPKDRMTTYAVTRADGYGMDGAEVVEDIGTAAKRADLVENGLSKVDSKIYDALDEEGATRLGKFLVRKGDDEIIESINKLEPDTARKIFSTSADDIGVRTKRMTRVRISVIKATGDSMTDREARQLMNDLEGINGLKNYKMLSESIADASGNSNVKDFKFQVEQAARYRKLHPDDEIVIEPMNERLDLRVKDTFIEQKTMSSSNLRNFIHNNVGKANKQLGDSIGAIRSVDGKTRVELDLRKVDVEDRQVRDEVNNWLDDVVQKSSKTQNNIDEIRVYTAEGESFNLKPDGNGHFKIEGT